MLVVAFLCLVLAAHAQAESYTLYHRFPPANFEPRGTVNIEHGGVHFVTAADIPAPEGNWYQVALDVDGQMLMASTRSCFASDDALLTLQTSASGKPMAIEYKPEHMTRTGGCADVKSLGNGKVQVSMHAVGSAREPSLAPPPQVNTETGAVVEPEPEKSLIQKYWPYAAMMLFMIMVTGGGEDPKPAAAPTS